MEVIRYTRQIMRAVKLNKLRGYRMKETSEAELKDAIKEVRIAVQDCFGIIPVCYDGKLTVRRESYDELANKLNKLTLKVK